MTDPVNAREKLTEAITDLRSQDGWLRWVSARRHFRRYSFNNQLLIAVQCPGATRVMGFVPWLKFGRCVAKGQHGIRIFGPPVHPKDSDAAVIASKTNLGASPDQKLFWPIVTVFDISQTKQLEPQEGREWLPLGPPEGETVGDPLAAAAAYIRLKDHMLEQGWKLIETHEPEGWCRPDNRTLCVGYFSSPLPRLRTLVHEAAHALGEVGYTSYGRKDAEVIVDTVTWVVLDGLGIQSGDSIPYVAGWSALAEETIKEYAHLIDSLAKQIETAIKPAEVADDARSAA